MQKGNAMLVYEPEDLDQRIRALRDEITKRGAVLAPMFTEALLQGDAALEKMSPEFQRLNAESNELIREFYRLLQEYDEIHAQDSERKAPKA